VTKSYTKGIVPSLIVVNFSRDTTVPVAVAFNLALLLLALRGCMCIFAVSAIFKVTRIGPAVVFSR
jgi:hypothetical protein